MGVLVSVASLVLLSWASSERLLDARSRRLLQRYYAEAERRHSFPRQYSVSPQHHPDGDVGRKGQRIEDRSRVRDETERWREETDPLVSLNEGLRNELFESDILLTPAQIRHLLRSSRRRQKRKIIAFPNYRWPRNNIQYRFSSSDASWQSAIMEAIELWRESTCLVFLDQAQLPARRRTRSVIDFVKGQGCYSLVGRVGGRQAVSIGDGCESAAIVAHELAHALGLWHEQSRADRDAHVKVNWAQISRGAAGNFEKRNHFDSEDFGVPYDIGSVMHYSSRAFGRGGSQTLSPLNPDYSRTLGQREGLTFTDIKVINQAYCSNTCRGRGAECEGGGYANPAACSTCLCPRGLGGDHCSQAQRSSNADCRGGTLTATDEYQTLSPGRLEAEQLCVWRLVAEPGRRVLLELDSLDFPTKPTCTSYLELKLGPNFEASGPRFCEDIRSSFMSANSTLLVIQRTDGSASGRRGFVARFVQGPSNGDAGEWLPWGPCSVSIPGTPYVCVPLEKCSVSGSHCGKTLSLGIPCGNESQYQRVLAGATNLTLSGLPGDFPTDGVLLLQSPLLSLENETTATTVRVTAATTSTPGGTTVQLDVDVASVLPLEEGPRVGAAVRTPTSPPATSAAHYRILPLSDSEPRTRRLGLGLVRTLTRRRLRDHRRRQAHQKRAPLRLTRLPARSVIVFQCLSSFARREESLRKSHAKLLRTPSRGRSAGWEKARRPKRQVIRLKPVEAEELCPAAFLVHCPKREGNSGCVGGGKRLRRRYQGGRRSRLRRLLKLRRLRPSSDHRSKP